MSDDFDEERYEEETKELGMFFWITLILGFAFPLVWFLTAMAFYEFWEWENKKSKYEKIHKPKIGLFKKIKFFFSAVFDFIIIIAIIVIILAIFL